MVDYKKYAGLLVGQFVNEGVEEAGNEVSKTTPTVFGLKTTTLVDLLVGVGGLVGAAYLDKKGKAPLVSMLTGIVGAGSLARLVTNVAMGRGYAMAVPRYAPSAIPLSVKSMRRPAGMQMVPLKKKVAIY